MKKIQALMFAVLFTSAIAAPAGKLGLGLRLGRPTGVDLKYWLNGVNALDFAFGWANTYGPGRYGYDDNRCYDPAFYDNNRGYCNGRRLDYLNGYGYGYNNFHLHGDYLWHNFKAIQTSFPIPLYYGVGAQYEYLRDYSESWLGARGTFGISFMPRNIPFDFFAELTPVLWLLPGPGFDMYGGVGARFWF